MLTPAHVGPPVAPGELWTAWNWDPLVWFGLATATFAYLESWSRTARRDDRARRRRRSMVAALGVLVVALISPLDALGVSLSSAHMVQHLLLTVVAAPLLVLAAPVRTVSNGLPVAWRRRTLALRHTPAARAWRYLQSHPVVASVPFVVVLWAWHAPSPYDAALGNHLLHGLEHVTFLATAVISWAAILHPGRRPARRGNHGPGTAVLVLFGLSVVSGLLGVLLTFASAPLYPSYETTAPSWGLSALADQQLAGVIMWIPGGGIYFGVAVATLLRWLQIPAADTSSLSRVPTLPPG